MFDRIISKIQADTTARRESIHGDRHRERVTRFGRQIASVPKKEIQTQLTRERKLLKLLKVDSHAPSPTWFEDQCKLTWGPGHLLLSGYAPGHESGIQTGLDFSEHETELFGSQEMGDDALRVLALCMESQGAIIARLKKEIPVLSPALKWSRKVSR